MPSAAVLLVGVGAIAVAVVADQADGPSFGALVGTCIGWGGPLQLRTFDSAQVSYYSSGEYYLVRAPGISIQAQYLPTDKSNEFAVTKRVAIGGPILEGNKLVIGPVGAYWNNAPVLSSLGSSFSIPGLLTASYETEGGALIDTTGAVDGSSKRIVFVNINDGSPKGISIQINRWAASPENEFVNWKIDMHSRLGQDGACGNFNGNRMDDGRFAVRQRVGSWGVPLRQTLFAKKTSISSPDLNNCQQYIINAAQAKCTARLEAPSRSCLVTYCFGTCQQFCEGINEDEFCGEQGACSCGKECSRGRQLRGNPQFI